MSDTTVAPLVLLTFTTRVDIPGGTGITVSRDSQDAKIAGVPVTLYGDGCDVMITDDTGKEIGLLYLWLDEAGQLMGGVGGWREDGDWLGQNAPIRNDYIDGDATVAPPVSPANEGGQ